MTDYGVSLDAILSGKEKIPPQGARIDVAFEGRTIGRLAGRVRGIDYLRMRAAGHTGRYRQRRDRSGHARQVEERRVRLISVSLEACAPLPLAHSHA